ncbi:MAG TPA: alpha/beta fold hydrolase, partial [Ktedonobacterales bacterium]|nr:alpha/beta fold hydrolase [Ktedonobacterales bacterium]
PLVLTHEGIADHRMYDDQFAVFAGRYQTIRYDLRGFGQSSMPSAPFSYHDDLAELLRALGVARAHVLGMSMGGAASINFALSHPEMVSALVLAGSALGGFPRPEMGNDPINDPIMAEFQTAAAAQDHQRLAELAVRVWVVGTGRTAEQVDPRVRQRVAEMELHNLSLGSDESQARELDPPAYGRLGAIHVPTLIIAGDRDLPHILRIADALAAGIAGARQAIMPNTAHVPNMEQPAAFNQLVLDFLAGV